MADMNQVVESCKPLLLDWKCVNLRRKNGSHIAEGLENTSTRGVFVLLNDHTICSVFTQNVPGSYEETDSASQRWEIILHSHWLLVALFLSQSESHRRDILSETRRHTAWCIWMGYLTTPSQPGLGEQEGMKERSVHEILIDWQAEEADETDGNVTFFNTQFS